MFPQVEGGVVVAMRTWPEAHPWFVAAAKPWKPQASLRKGVYRLARAALILDSKLLHVNQFLQYFIHSLAFCCFCFKDVIMGTAFFMCSILYTSGWSCPEAFVNFFDHGGSPPPRVWGCSRCPQGYFCCIFFTLKLTPKVLPDSGVAGARQVCNDSPPPRRIHAGYHRAALPPCVPDQLRTSAHVLAAVPPAECVFRAAESPDGDCVVAIGKHEPAHSNDPGRKKYPVAVPKQLHDFEVVILGPRFTSTSWMSPRSWPPQGVCLVNLSGTTSWWVFGFVPLWLHFFSHFCNCNGVLVNEYHRNHLLCLHKQTI